MNLNLGDTQLIIKECQKQGLSVYETAYVLATAYHETAHTMKPVREYGGETYLKKKKYYPYVGMGYVQLTWKYNYEKASKILGVDFVGNPKLLLDPKYAVVILVTGMKEGWFTGKKLSSYITNDHKIYSDRLIQYKSARRIINGTDKQSEIAEIAWTYLTDLQGKVPSEPVREVPKDHVPVTPEPKESFWVRLLRLILGG